MTQRRGVPIVTFPLATTACSRCGQLGVSVVVVSRTDAPPRCWCAPDCARRDGWPWLRGAPKRAAGRRRSRVMKGNVGC